MTYPKIRPRELRDVKEKQLNLKDGIMVIESPKAGHEPKVIKLLPEDVELIKSLPRGFPEMYFLRYEKTGKRFGPNRVTMVWLRACRELKIMDVCLYAGTKHTTVSELAKTTSSRLLEKAAGISERALRRYAILREEECQNLYRQARPDTALIPDFGHFKKSNLP
jgi:integrase